MQDVTQTAQNRTVVGKQVRGLRRDGVIPAVIHEKGKESVNIQIPELEMIKLYDRAGQSTPIELDVDGKDHFVLIKQVDVSPKKGTIRHVVFNTIRRGEKTNATVSVVFDGTSAAERAGLIVVHHIDELEITALPKNLPENLVVDVTNLENPGDKLSVADITLPEGVEVNIEPETTIATVEEPRAAVEETAEEDAEGEEAAEGDGEGDGESSESSEESKE